MQIKPGVVSSLYQKFWKANNWSKEVMWGHAGQVTMYLLSDEDFISVNIGTCEDDFCVSAPFNEVVNLLKYCSDDISVKYKNSKLNFTSSDSVLQFAVTTQECDKPSALDFKDYTEIELPVEDIMFASNYAGYQYPVNHVYYDLDNKAFLVADVDAILCCLKFKKASFGIPKKIAKIFASFSNPVFYYNASENKLLVNEDVFAVHLNIISSDPSLADYQDLVVVNDDENVLIENIDNFKKALEPHIGFSTKETVFGFDEAKKQCKIQSILSNNSAAIQTTFEYAGAQSYTINFMAKELNSLINFIAKKNSRFTIAHHPVHSNIVTIYTDDLFFATV
jgi:hypothetical protein